MSSYRHLLVNFEGPLCHVTINRPEVLNALNTEVIEELRTVVTEATLRDSIRCLILAGAGEKAFVAGADIGAMSSMDPAAAVAFSRHGQALTLALEAAPFVTVAKVQGFALGGGCELAMATDIIVASKKAKFAQPEVSLGLIPGFGGTQRLVRRVGFTVALDMLLCGRNLSGEDAFALGLVARVTEPERLDQEVNLLVKALLKNGPQAVRETKRLARNAANMSLAAGLEAEANAFGAGFARHEAREGLKAFLEKRRPEYSL